jgi:hypothetical protein
MVKEVQMIEPLIVKSIPDRSALRLSITVHDDIIEGSNSAHLIDLYSEYVKQNVWMELTKRAKTLRLQPIPVKVNSRYDLLKVNPLQDKSK